LGSCALNSSRHYRFDTADESSTRVAYLVRSEAVLVGRAARHSESRQSSRDPSQRKEQTTKRPLGN
jgi:hypothetical protein